MINPQEKMLPTRQGSNLQPPDHQSDEYPTDPPRPAVDQMNAASDLDIVTDLGRPNGCS